MSMRALELEPDLDVAQDEPWIEDEIQRELEALDPADLDEPKGDDEEDVSNEHQTETENEEFPSMLKYMNHVKRQADRLKEELDECDELLQQADLVSARNTIQTQHLWEDLAREEGTDAETLRKQVLEDLEQEEEAERQYQAECTDQNGNCSQDLAAVAATGGAFITAVDGEQNTIQVKSSGVEEKEADSSMRVADGKVNSGRPSEEVPSQLPESSRPDSTVGEAKQFLVTSGETREGISLKPEEGVVAEIYECDVLEQQLRLQVLELDDRKRKQEMDRRQEEEARKLEDDVKMKDSEERRKQKQQEIQQTESQLSRERQEKEARLKQEAEQTWKLVEESLQKYQVHINTLAEQTRKEQVELDAARRQEKVRQEQRQQAAAVKLQATYRGYRVRKVYRTEIEKKMERWRIQKEQDRITSIEKEREKSEAEERRKKEEIERRLEQERKRQEEEKKKQERIAAEKKRREEEERRKEEVRRLEEERKREEEERRKEEVRRLEEERKREEEEKKRQEKIAAEKKSIEEEKKKEDAARRHAEERKEEEDRKRKEEEKNRQEKIRLEERRRKENEERQKEEARKAKEEEKRKEEQRKRQEEEKGKTEEQKLEKERQKKEEGKRTEDAMVVPTSQSSTYIVAQCSKQRAGITPRLSMSTTQDEWGDYLPSQLEKKRLSWIKQCKPWSKIKADLKVKRGTGTGGRRPPRRPISAKKLPTLTASQILGGAGGTSALQQVVTVELHDLPGCTLKSLGQCPHLQTLTMNNCGLVAVDELEHCKQLQCVDLQHNSIEMIQLRDCHNLLHVDLSHNSLTSVHGLDGCESIRYLNVSHNRITRIGGLSSLKKLHTLNMSRNQLITTKSLSEAPTIQHLDLSHNHLPHVDDLDKLGLLQWLNVSGNNLLQVPRLTNQILLYHLVLSDNSISSLATLCDAWLPMLKCLEVAQNSLSSLPNLQVCVLLEKLDTSNNQVSDLESILPGLCSLHSLQFLHLEGNPVAAEAEYRDRILKALPTIKSTDGMDRKTAAQEPKRTNFEHMCLGHQGEHQKLKEAHAQALRQTSSKETHNAIHLQYFDRSHQLAEDQRLAHEYGETAYRETAQTTFKLSASATASQAKESAQSQAVDMKAKFEAVLNSVQDRSRLGTVDRTQLVTVDSVSALDFAVVTKEVKRESSVEPLQEEPCQQLVSAKQRDGGSSLMRQPVIPSSRISESATAMGKMTQEEGKKISAIKVGDQKDIQLFEKSAIKIQALWRGHSLRKKLHYALTYARCGDFEDEDHNGNSNDFGEEIDLDAFEFNMDDVEKDWIPADTPQIPQSHPVLGKMTINGLASDRRPPLPPQPPCQPRRAWRATESPTSDAGCFPSGKPPLPPLSRMSDGPETQRTVDTHATGLSKKGEKISEEWGFKDARTAELMLQRAKKLKYNAVRKKKISQLDPKQRLALFRKLEESTKLRPVHPPPRKQQQRKEYFKAREAEEEQRGQVRVEEKRERASRTYEWVHTQVGSYDVGTSVINQGLERSSHHNSDGNLPKMDPGVLVGGRTLLTGSPQSLDLQSAESAPASAAQLAHKPRRWSVAGSNSSASGERLPPLKQTSSAPSSTPSVAAPKIGTASWRQPQVQQSVGWGGGKKRVARR